MANEFTDLFNTLASNPMANALAAAKLSEMWRRQQRENYRESDKLQMEIYRRRLDDIWRR